MNHTQLLKDIADLKQKYSTSKSIPTADQIIRVCDALEKLLWEKKDNGK
jgi:hypothetical protein